MRQNKWHAPVRKAEIIQSILDRSDEPRDSQIDLAIIAHQIERFGAERDAGYEKKAAARAQGGYGSIRKQREAKMLELRRQERERKKRQDELSGVAAELNSTGAMPKIEGGNSTAQATESGADDK